MKSRTIRNENRRAVASGISSFRKTLTIFCILLCVLVASPQILAQDKDSGQNYHPGIPYSISDVESINNTNGNLMFNFDFGSAQGRGSASAGFSLKYNSKLYESHIQTAYSPDSTAPGNMEPQKFLRASDEGGWKYEDDYRMRIVNRNDDQDNPIQVGGGCEQPNYDGVFLWKLLMYFPDGSQHEFRPTGYSDTLQNSSGATFYNGNGFFNVSPSTGTIHTLNVSGPASSSGCPGGQIWSTSVTTSQDTSTKMVYYSADSTYMRLEIDKNSAGAMTGWTIYMPDGSKVERIGTVPTKIYDRNGNYVTKGTVTLPDGTTAEAYKDQVGRYVAKKTISSTEDRFYRLGFNSELITWIVKWKYVSVIKAYTTSGTGGGSGLLRCCYSDQVLTAQHKVVDEIQMPSQLGGLKYTFTYDGHAGQVSYTPSNPNYSSGWGELTSVTLPSGAKAEYDYAQIIGSLLFTDFIQPLLGKIKEKRLIYDSNYDGSTTQETDTWSYQISPAGSTSITGPDGGVSTLIFYNTTNDNDFSGRVYKSTSPDGTIIESLWKNNQPGGFIFGGIRRLNTYVKTTFTTIPSANGTPSLTAINDLEYDKNGNVTKVTEYDFVTYSSLPRDSTGKVSGIPSSAVKKRITENVIYYPTPDASNTTTSDPDSYWLATARRIGGAVKYTTVKTASGTPVAHTQFVYDNPHTKGNVKEVRKWDSTKGVYTQALTSANWIRTRMTYDTYGNPVNVYDANNNRTIYTYGAVSGHSGLYPTMVRTAYGTTVKRTSTTQYDFQTGAVTLATDTDNGVSTATEYDALGRPTKVKAAVGTSNEIWTQKEYSDSARRVITKSDLNVKGDAKIVSISHYDQLGRLRLSRSLENAATQSPTNETHGIKVQSRYKTANPHSYSVTSNPYRASTSAGAGSEQTMGWTRSKAWNTGRRSESESFSGAAIPAPWGSNSATTGKVITERDAEASTVTDQAGKKRRSITNALGHLIRVDEPNAAGSLGTKTAPVQPTSYSYDSSGNLVEVTQGVQKRYFGYDSLGSLLRVRQPEQQVNSSINLAVQGTGNTQWSGAFSYDSNGNVLTSKDAKNVTITYTYDQLNRMKTSSYSDGTPAVTNTYDSSTVPFSKGSLTKTSNSISTSEVTAFDRFGRVLSSRQLTDGQTYNSSYQYSLSGRLTQETYPTGRVLTNAYDVKGDLITINGQKSGVSKNYANSVVYTASGHIEKIKLGNNRWEAAKFNGRLQVTEMGLGTSATNLNLWKINLEYGELNTNDTVNAAKNSGNLAKQTISFSGASPFVQTYKYDSNDRLIDAKEKTGSSQNWKQTFGFDRYGNRTAFTQVIGSNNLPTNNFTRPTISPSTNRINAGQGYTYDLSGNLISDPEGRQYTFNGDNKQIQVKNAQNQVIGTYYYDGDGKRIKKVTATETTTFVYSGGKKVAEYSSKTPLSQSITKYLTTDTLGSIRAISDQSGNIVSRRDFMPFGEELYAGTPNRSTSLKFSPGGDNVLEKFTGYERDPETGLDFAEARYYQNKHGRFTAVDPLLASGRSANPQTFNRYAYALSNPLAYTDPTGLQVGSKQEPCAATGCTGKVTSITTHRDGNGKPVQIALTEDIALVNISMSDFDDEFIKPIEVSGTELTGMIDALAPEDLPSLSPTQQMLQGGAYMAEAGLEGIEEVATAIDTASDVIAPVKGIAKFGLKKGVKHVVKQLRKRVSVAPGGASRSRMRPSHGGGRGRSQRTRPTGKRGQEAQDQLEGITKAQEKVRKGKGRGKIIDSKKKSQQKVDNVNKKLRNLKDALDEYEQ